MAGHSELVFGLCLSETLLLVIQTLLAGNGAKPSLGSSFAIDSLAFLKGRFLGLGLKVGREGPKSLLQVVHSAFDVHSFPGEVPADNHEPVGHRGFSFGGPVLDAMAFEGERGAVSDDVVDYGLLECKADVVAIETFKLLESAKGFLEAFGTEGVSALENVRDVGDGVENAFTSFAD